MHRVLVALGLVLVAAGAARALDVNVVEASSAGCSPDAWTDPDLRVTVRVGGIVVLQTEKAQDTEEPYFAVVAATTAAQGAKVSIEVEEAEPGGFLGLGTTWILCDVAPGSAAVLNLTWDGATMDVLAIGDGSHAARARVVLGSGPPAPKLEVAAGAFSANLSWDADPTGAASGHRIGPGGNWFRPGRPLGASAGTLELAPLCDNSEHTYRVVREAAPWAVGSSITFRTLNAAPTAPRVLAAKANATNVSVAWESATAHDIAAYEVHAGPAGFEVDAASRRVDATQRNATFERRPGDIDVVVRSVDSGGLSATSAPFSIGEPDRAPILTPGGCPRTTITNVADESPPSAANDADDPPLEDGEPAAPPPDGTSGDEGRTVTPQTPPRPAFGWVALGLALLGGAVAGAAIVLAKRR
ncbi:MAG TPA: hypothetical protein VI997_01460 [Candidatus Thermoplasmatota archaeon]|nr:hypothetical protein [Candidatus Thermoplasmatota archaeon]